MRKRFNFDKKYRSAVLKKEFTSRLLKYVACASSNSSASQNSNQDVFLVENWKNKSFKNFNNSASAKRASRIRNFCIVSGRGRGLSKNYFSVSRNAFKYLQAVGLLPGVYKSS